MDDWAPSDSAVEAVTSYIKRTGLGPRLDAMLTHRLGRPRAMPSNLYLSGFYLNALRKGHRGCVLDAARALHLVSAPLKELLGVPDIPLRTMYRRFDAWLNAVTQLLVSDPYAPVPPGESRLTMFEMCQEIARSPLTDTYLRWPSIAIDGTDFPTFGNLHLAHNRLPLDGDAVYDYEGHIFGGAAGPPPWEPDAHGTTKGGAKVFGIGSDDREIHTLDPDARSGWRTGTDKRHASKFEGYEIHSACPMAVLKHTDQVTSVALGPTPLQVCLGFNLTSAGTHRGTASLAVIEDLAQDGHIHEVAADRGITYMRGYLERLRILGIQSVHTLHATQRKLTPGPPGSVMIDQTLLSDATPEALLQELPLPPVRASAEVRAPYEELFNARALYRWRTHAGPDHRGAIRLACPICSSPHLRCRQVGSSMRLPNSAPLVQLPDGRSHCCSTGTVTFSAREYPAWMGPVVPFTSAHFLSYGRRNAAETLNSYLHGLYVDVNEEWAEVFGTAKRAFVLAFTFAALNHHQLNGTVEEPPARALAKRIQTLVREQGTPPRSKSSTPGPSRSTRRISQRRS